MSLGLFLTCLVCSATLAVVHAVTEDPIKKAAAEKVKKAIEVVVPEFDSEPVQKAIEIKGVKYKYYEVAKAGKPAGYAIESSAIGFGGSLDLMVGVTPNGIVYNTSVLSHSETPGLGAKCATDESFINQFRNLDRAKTKKLAVKKDGGSIDAITASTITSRAYIQAVKDALNIFSKIKEMNND